MKCAIKILMYILLNIWEYSSIYFTEVFLELAEKCSLLIYETNIIMT